MADFQTDFGIRLNVTFKTHPFPAIQADKNLSPTPLTKKKRCIEKQKDLITQSECEPRCFRKSSRLCVTRPLEEDQVLQYVGSDLSTSGSQGFSDALGLAQFGCHVSQSFISTLARVAGLPQNGLFMWQSSAVSSLLPTGSRCQKLKWTQKAF